MSAHLARAELLLAQSRPADAEREARQALAQDPHNASAHAFLALCCIQLNRGEDALQEARAAVGLAPTDPTSHRIHGFVLHRLDRQGEALAAVDQALRLDPNDADAHVLRSAVKLASRDWKAALESSESALALDPEHVEAANFRAMALTQLGRKVEAAQTVDYALHREPDNALSHANQGWNSLHQNNPRKAKEHFREALRLDPSLEFAREGMLEALKARNPIYRLMLAYYLWIGRQSGWLQGACIAGIFFGGRIIEGFSAAAPGYGWFFTPLKILFYAFIYLSWTAQPLFNLMLRLDRFGRHVLSRDQRIGSTVFGIVFAGLVGACLWWQVGKSDLGFELTIILAVLSLCVAATWSRRGSNRALLAAGTLGLAGLGIATLFLIHGGNPYAEKTMTAFYFGFIGFQFAAIGMRGR